MQEFFSCTQKVALWAFKRTQNNVSAGQQGSGAIMLGYGSGQ